MHPNACWTMPHQLHALLDRERFPDPIWEPTAGAGWIAAPLRTYGYEVVTSDIDDDYGFRLDHRLDFLRQRPTWAFNSIITNPPYAGEVDRWLQRQCAYGVKTAALAPITILHHLMEPQWPWPLPLPLKSVIGFSRKLSKMVRPDGSDGSSNWNVAWFVFCPDHVGPYRGYLIR